MILYFTTLAVHSVQQIHDLLPEEPLCVLCVRQNSIKISSAILFRRRTSGTRHVYKDQTEHLLLYLSVGVCLLWMSVWSIVLYHPLTRPPRSLFVLLQCINTRFIVHKKRIKVVQKCASNAEHIKKKGNQQIRLHRVYPCLGENPTIPAGALNKNTCSPRLHTLPNRCARIARSRHMSPWAGARARALTAVCTPFGKSVINSC